MGVIGRVLGAYIRLFDGGDGPYLPIERDYLRTAVAGGRVIADIGGGEGKLARELAATARWVLLVDKEENPVDGGDPNFYQGTMGRALKRGTPNICAIRGDAVALPFATSSLDAIVSSQFLEHITDDQKAAFFLECARTVKPGGIVAVSTPNGDYIGRYGFWLPRVARRLLPPAVIARLPRTLRGAWLEQSLEDWERQVGHHDHGCRIQHLRELSRRAGFTEVRCRFLHTRLTAFWFQMLLTFPAVFLIALPLVRLLYAVEARLPLRDGVNMMLSFRREGAQPGALS